ncbi:MAG: hypothetical protein KJZ54_00575 [Phycisphaerales bacterium]|nr:hypothetical protein [Phycisphaerales bacterium]
MRGRNAFDEVRSILGRLDESISEARRRRLGDDGPDAVPPTHDAASNGHAARTPHANGHAPTNGPSPGDARQIGGQREEEPISPSRAKYGKARPIRPLNAAAHDHHEQPRRTA